MRDVVRNLECGNWYLEPGIWNAETGNWYLETGMRKMENGKLRSKFNFSLLLSVPPHFRGLFLKVRGNCNVKP
jgi:hypothetical protein